MWHKAVLQQIAALCSEGLIFDINNDCDHAVIKVHAFLLPLSVLQPSLPRAHESRQHPAKLLYSIKQRPILCIFLASMILRRYLML